MYERNVENNNDDSDDNIDDNSDDKWTYKEKKYRMIVVDPVSYVEELKNKYANNQLQHEDIKDIIIEEYLEGTILQGDEKTLARDFIFLLLEEYEKDFEKNHGKIYKYEYITSDFIKKNKPIKPFFFHQMTDDDLVYAIGLLYEVLMEQGFR